MEQVIDLLVFDKIKETLSPACLRRVLSTEGTGWFAPEKLTEVIDTYENSQMYLPGKYSKFSGHRLGEAWRVFVTFSECG